MSFREWRWVGGWTALVTVLITLPHWLASRFPPGGRQFLGSFWSPHDLSQYKAAMYEAAVSGSWLVHDRLTPEPHEPALIYPVYVALGKLASTAHLDLSVVYWMAVTLSRAFLMVAIYLFSAAVLDNLWQRRAAFFLIIGSSGLAAFLGVAEIALPSLANDPILRPEWNFPEVNTLLTLFTYPHLIMALGLLLLAGRSYVLWMKQGRWLHLATLIVAVVFLGFANPFSLIPIAAALGISLAVEVVFLRRPALRHGAAALSVWAIVIPFFVYNWMTFARDPFWGAVYGTQNVLPTPNPLILVSGLGVIVPLAALGIRGMFRRSNRSGLFLCSWIVVSLVLAYTPLPFQRRFAFGVHPLLGVMAVYGLAAIFTGTEDRKPVSTHRFLSEKRARYVLIVLLGFSSLTFYLQTVATPLPLGRGEVLRNLVFEQQAVIDASRWLSDETTAQDIVLAHERSGNYLAGEIPGRVFVAHRTASLNPEMKREELRIFADGATEDVERHRILDTSGADFLFYGPYERTLGSFQPKDADFLALAYKNSEVEVYRYVRSDR